MMAAMTGAGRRAGMTVVLGATMIAVAAVRFALPLLRVYSEGNRLPAVRATESESST